MKPTAQIREISTLSFNERVLQEAEDERNPLLERLRFLGIFSSNMDEFFKVRVASIQRRWELGKKSMWPLLEEISEKARALEDRFQRAYAKIISALREHNIVILSEKDIGGLPPDLRRWLHEYWRSEVRPRLVPIIVHDTKSFPQVKDGAIYFAILMDAPKARYALLEIPQELPRFVSLPNQHILYVDDLIRYYLPEIFHILGAQALAAYEFKISRDAELDIDNDFSEGYVRKMERVLQQRKKGRPTRLAYDVAIPQDFLEFLKKGLQITKEDTLVGGGRYHNMKDLMRFPVQMPSLVFEPLPPSPHPVLGEPGTKPMFDTVLEKDVLVTFPYQSFDHMIQLLREAAIDPEVKSIKISLYRVAKNSQVVNALINAAQNGKKIFAVVELLARFDEKNNIGVTERLKEVGATVVHGLPPMKTHAKILLIERKKTAIAGLCTGNFNEDTGELYVDSLLLTADKRLTQEVALIFDFLEHASRLHTITTPRFKHLAVSPFTMRRTVLRLIERERKKGPNGYIFLKVNHLTDDRVIEKLRAAADAGVKMDFVVRTTYALNAHPNIRAISILDRFLEHQRCWIFGRGEDADIYLTSADLMERNLDWRVEVAFPIYSPCVRKQVQDMMQIQIHDTVKARILDEHQTNRYVYEVEPIDGRKPVRAQYATWEYFRAAASPDQRESGVDAPATETTVVV